jgi:hypothetical protein
MFHLGSPLSRVLFEQPSLNCLDVSSLFLFKFFPIHTYKPFVDRVPQLTTILLMELFDLLFLNPISLAVGKPIDHDLFGDSCAMPHGFGQFSVELGRRAVRLSGRARLPLIRGLQ